MAGTPHVMAHCGAHVATIGRRRKSMLTTPPWDRSCLHVIYLQWILHDWSDEDCSRLLKNCYDALPDNGKVIVVEYILPSVPDTSTTSRSLFQLDLLMLAYCPGGKERTEQEYQKLAKGSGFAAIKKACTAYDMWVLEFYQKI
ncbi:hypothetical protein ACLOJK_032103 [Asimina triloba]